MSLISSYSIDFPLKWDQSEWERRIQAEENTDLQQILIYQAKHIHLINDVVPSKANPERLGWLSLWNKSFVALEGVVSAMSRSSHHVIQLLYRSSFEARLHLMSIVDVIEDHVNENTHEGSQSTDTVVAESIIDRLRAYLSWCIWNDKSYLAGHTRDDHLREAYDPKPAEEILSNDKMKRFHEMNFGDISIETNPTILAQQMVAHKEQASKDINRLDSWLNDEELVKWRKKIEELSATKRFRHGAIPFYALLDLTEGSVRLKLKSLGLAFAYLCYQEGSMISHGSSFEKSMIVDENNITPKFCGTSEDVNNGALDVGSNCNYIYVILSAIKPYLW